VGRRRRPLAVFPRLVMVAGETSVRRRAPFPHRVGGIPISASYDGVGPTRAGALAVGTDDGSGSIFQSPGCRTVRPWCGSQRIAIPESMATGMNSTL